MQKPKMLPWWMMLLCLVLGLATTVIPAPWKYVTGSVSILIAVAHFVQVYRLASWAVQEDN